eukprot:CAMPEP_0174268342 /NCGR_PEP_ID=MMETSP0439-20130205/37068_1 /TAXON_ID=0 /ORGANISM="Stereomyxa ramosa, Strain Chinc5" /LENGTH=193 /DNA_ID=CAMNT_0015356449 /DNA_START=202 /DNA_END=780 /DNA_ORIENTATION=-
MVALSDCVFLDDIGTNLKSALKLGMKTIKVIDPRKAVQQLENCLGLKLSYQSIHKDQAANSEPFSKCYDFVDGWIKFWRSEMTSDELADSYFDNTTSFSMLGNDFKGKEQAKDFLNTLVENTGTTKSWVWILDGLFKNVSGHKIKGISTWKCLWCTQRQGSKVLKEMQVVVSFEINPTTSLIDNFCLLLSDLD